MSSKELNFAEMVLDAVARDQKVDYSPQNDRELLDWINSQLRFLKEEQPYLAQFTSSMAESVMREVFPDYHAVPYWIGVGLGYAVLRESHPELLGKKATEKIVDDYFGVFRSRFLETLLSQGIEGVYGFFHELEDRHLQLYRLLAGFDSQAQTQPMEIREEARDFALQITLGVLNVVEPLTGFMDSPSGKSA